MEADRQYLWQMFLEVDTDRSGFITATELQQSLMSGSWEPFNLETCRLMVNMFDKENRGRVSFQDFGALWKYVTDWQECFNRFDKDGSGSINNIELLTALQAFGFKLSLKTVDAIMKRFERHERGADGSQEGILYFDDFIHCGVILHNITDGFKTRDEGNKGEINITYEDLIALVFSAGL